MPSYRAATATFTIVLAALALLVPITPAGAQNNNIVSDDFAAGTRRDALTANVPIRRGVTTKVQIIKDFIDLVPFGQVSISGGGTISSLSNGRSQNGQGMGFIAMNIAVPAGQSLGSTITLKVGLIDQFKFKTVPRGEIATISRSPDPATIQAATPWVATIQGTDIGDVIVSPINCHTITHSSRTANAVTATLTRSAGCTTNTYGVALQGSSGDDPPSFNLAAGPTAGFQFAYAPAGVACVSQPNIGQTNIRQPQTSQVIQFRPQTPSPANVTISWDSVTSNSTPAPNNEWIVTRSVKRGAISSPLASVTVRGLSTTQAFLIPGTHTVTVRPKNCGQTAPSTSVTFSTQLQ